ncbi:MAG: hypothetical protein RMK84_06940 [Oscillochloridaceae bacterium]|nr:hypothetical protein [Chloroflexaceae bacterium]MDW8389845.1 hypothetical protein [Oscillochloridaceae bacterium]
MQRSLLIFILLLICYTYVLPRWSDWNQNSRLNLVLAMVDDGTVSIDRYVANTGDYAIYEGRAYTDKPPGLSFLAMPVYMVLSPALNIPPVRERLETISSGTAFQSTLREDGSGLRADKIRFALVQYALTLAVVAIAAAGLGVVFHLALVRLGVVPSLAALGALAYGLGTSAAPYAGNFYSHQVAAALLFGAFFVAWPRDDERGRPAYARGLLCGLLLGWAVISEYPVVLPAALIGLYALARRGWRWIGPLALGGAMPLALLIVYDLVAFGTPLPIGYAHSALWQEQHHTGFMSITGPRIEALWGLTFGAFRGLFVRAPWLLLALPAAILWWRGGERRAEWWLLVLAPLTLILFYGSSVMWWGGFAAGPRYIVPIIPFLALSAAWLAARLWSRPAGRTAVTTLVIGSIALVWAESLAGQLFPTDAIRNTWTGYVFPAWAAGDIARNLGMVLGLTGPWSLIPLLLAILALAGLMVVPRNHRRSRPSAIAGGNTALVHEEVV